MELREIVAAHQPDEASAWRALLQNPDEVGGVARSELRSAPVMTMRGCAATSAARSHPSACGGRPAASFSGLAGRHQPPDPVEPEPVERHQARAAVADMRRVERAAVEADPLPRPVRRQAGENPARSRRCRVTAASGRCRARDI